jgi:uncharacterized membrane protein
MILNGGMIMNEGLAPDIRIWLAKGWDTYKKNPVPLISTAAFLAILYLVLSFMGQSVIGVVLYYIVILFVYPVLWVGWCYICLKAVRGENTSFADLFNPISHYGPVWVTYILFTLIITGGAILIIIPGVIWWLKYGFCAFAIMDKKCAGTEAIKYSARITKGYKGQLFVFILIMLICGLLGFTFLIGFILSNTSWMLIGILPFTAAVLIVSPWLNASMAAAYESLRVHYEKKMLDAAIIAADSVQR